jgi:hypothetical protein
MDKKMIMNNFQSVKNKALLLFEKYIDDRGYTTKALLKDWPDEYSNLLRGIVSDLIENVNQITAVRDNTYNRKDPMILGDLYLLKSDTSSDDFLTVRRLIYDYINNSEEFDKMFESYDQFSEILQRRLSNASVK